MLQKTKYWLAKWLNKSLKTISDRLPVWDDVSVETVLAAQPAFIYTLPINFSSIPANLQDPFTHIAPLPDRRVLTVKNILSTNNGVVFKNLKVFIPSLAEPWVKDYLAHTFLLKQWYGHHIQLPPQETSVALVYDQWSNGNYYHWLIDSLPRLLLLRETHPQHLLLLPNEAANFVKETAAILGFNRFFFIKPDQILEAKEFLIPEVTAPSSFHDPALIQQVRKEIIASVGEYVQKPTRRFYVSRAKQTIRRLANEEAIIQLLLEHEFEVIKFEDYTFKQQVALMQEAEIVISIHGANLTNILFMQPGAKVIELINELNPYLIYYHLCSYLKLGYYFLPCKPLVANISAEHSQDIHYHNNSDIVVNKEDLIRILDSLFAPEAHPVQ